MIDFRLKFYIKSLLSGVLIGLGDIIYVVSENHILGAFLFSLGLLTILIKEYPLYTGRVGYVKTYDDFVDCSPMIVFNFIGIALVCALANITNLDLSAVNMIVSNKLHQEWYSTLFLAWGCGAMMYFAVNGWKKTGNPITVIMPIMFFILCGFEHCVADYGYFMMYKFKEAIDYDYHAGMFILTTVIGNALGSLTFSKI